MTIDLNATQKRYVHQLKNDQAKFRSYTTANNDILQKLKNRKCDVSDFGLPVLECEMYQDWKKRVNEILYFYDKAIELIEELQS